MRELRQHACTFKQENELFKLGLDESQKIYIVHDVLRHIILRCQALDFFMDLGYTLQIRANEKGHWYEVEKDGVTRTQGGLHTYEVSENELISRLIELEKEARNGYD